MGSSAASTNANKALFLEKVKLSNTACQNGDFEKAVDDIRNKIAKTMTDDELKEVYGLYKQATVGDINIEKPSVTDPKVRFP